MEEIKKLTSVSNEEPEILLVTQKATIQECGPSCGPAHGPGCSPNCAPQCAPK